MASPPRSRSGTSMYDDSSIGRQLSRLHDWFDKRIDSLEKRIYENDRDASSKRAEMYTRVQQLETNVNDRLEEFNTDNHRRWWGVLTAVIGTLVAIVIGLLVYIWNQTAMRVHPATFAEHEEFSLKIPVDETYYPLYNMVTGQRGQPENVVRQDARET